MIADSKREEGRPEAAHASHLIGGLEICDEDLADWSCSATMDTLFQTATFFGAAS